MMTIINRKGSRKAPEIETDVVCDGGGMGGRPLMMIINREPPAIDTYWCVCVCVCVCVCARARARSRVCAHANLNYGSNEHTTMETSRCCPTLLSCLLHHDRRGRETSRYCPDLPTSSITICQVGELPDIALTFQPPPLRYAR